MLDLKLEHYHKWWPRYYGAFVMKDKIHYSQEMANEVCEQIANGESLRSICAKDDMPSHEAVRKWRRMHHDFNMQYLAALLQQAESQFEDLVSIAENHHDVHRARLIIDTKKWCLERMNAKFRPHVQLHMAHKENLTDEELENIARSANVGAGSSTQAVSTPKSSRVIN